MGISKNIEEFKVLSNMVYKMVESNEKEFKGYAASVSGDLQTKYDELCKSHMI